MAVIVFWMSVTAIAVIGLGVLYNIAKDLLTSDQ